jgi:capsular exopolysaccharide synthesis family protein
MSRIHDALKRAEEERAARLVTPLDAQTAGVSEMGPTTQEGVLIKAAEDVVPSFTPEFDEGADQLTVEVLNTQVRRFKWNPNPKTMLFFGQEAYGPGTEEFRTLRSRLYGMRDLQTLRTLLITSASPQEGKSFIAANLAQIFVQQPDRRVLLIDGDLRWSRLHLSLGAPSTPGLSDYLQGETNELSILQRGPLDNLFFIAGGKHPSNPAELITGGRLKNLLQHLSPLFDWVIIDSPPAMAVSDPRVMADLCDGVLLVVAAGMQPYDIAQKTRQQFSDKRLLGVVLNQAEPRMSYSHKYYGYYHGPAEGGDRKGRD